MKFPLNQLRIFQEPTWKLWLTWSSLQLHTANPWKQAVQSDSGAWLNSLVFFTPSSVWSAERTFHVPAAAQVYHRHLLINILPEKPVTPAEGSGAVESSYRFHFDGRSRRIGSLSAQAVYIDREQWFRTVVGSLEDIGGWSYPYKRMQWTGAEATVLAKGNDTSASSTLTRRETNCRLSNSLGSV